MYYVYNMYVKPMHSSPYFQSIIHTVKNILNHTTSSPLIHQSASQRSKHNNAPHSRTPPPPPPSIPSRHVSQRATANSTSTQSIHISSSQKRKEKNKPSKTNQIKSTPLVRSYLVYLSPHSYPTKSQQHFQKNSLVPTDRPIDRQSNRLPNKE